MIRERGWALLLMLSLGCSAPAGTASHVPTVTSAPEAWIGPTAARFVFPPEPVQELTWDVPSADAFPDRSEYAWQVYWDVEWVARGTVPHALWLVTYWRAGGPRSGALREMLAGWPPWAMTECVECDGASVAKEDGALKSRLVKGRVEFTIQGAEGIQRIFPVIPDSVRLLRRLGAGAKDEVFTLPVRRMNP